MRYWWVNQNQPFRHELAGGYPWSPKRNANGAQNLLQNRWVVLLIQSPD